MMTVSKVKFKTKRTTQSLLSQMFSIFTNMTQITILRNFRASFHSCEFRSRALDLTSTSTLHERGMNLLDWIVHCHWGFMQRFGKVELDFFIRS